MTQSTFRFITTLFAAVGTCATAAATDTPTAAQCAIEVGLTPEVLVAAGAVDTDVRDIAAAITSAEPLRQRLALDRAEADAIAAEIGAINAASATRLLTAEELDRRRSLRLALKDAKATIAAIEALIRATCLSSEDEQFATDVERQIASLHRRVPPAMRVLSLSDDDWQRLERTLKHARAAGRNALNAADATWLNELESRPEVVAAETRLAAWLLDARAEFASATGD